VKVAAKRYDLLGPKQSKEIDLFVETSTTILEFRTKSIELSTVPSCTNT
jgi:3D (Asp-Asp-Asp) domain-containing protein